MQWMSSTGADPTWMHLLPSEEETVNEFHVREYFRTMYERHRVYINKEVMKFNKPWTDDPYLRDYKFCNVYRDLDRNSQWEIKNIITNPNLSLLDLVWQIVLFRIFNRPEFFDWMHQELLDGAAGDHNTHFKSVLPCYEEYNQQDFAECISRWREKGENPFTNAYLINSRACPGATRDDCYGTHIIPTVHANIPTLYKLMLKAKDPREIKDFLIQLPGIANFVAHEFYVSFCYVEKYTNRRLFKFDQNSWTNVGPGASLGLRLLFPSAKSNKEQEARMRTLLEMAETYIRKYFTSFEYYHWDKKKQQRYFIGSAFNLKISDIEFFLCEYQKYWKMTLGVGKQRSKYIPRDVR